MNLPAVERGQVGPRKIQPWARLAWYTLDGMLAVPDSPSCKESFASRSACTGGYPGT